VRRLPDLPRWWKRPRSDERAVPVSALLAYAVGVDSAADGYPQSVMAVNGLEAGLLALWALGVVSAILAGRRGGFTLRARVAILAAIFLPVLGSLLAIAYLGLTIARNPRRTAPRATA